LVVSSTFTFTFGLAITITYVGPRSSTAFECTMGC
jgi:hypothetical protein